MGHGVIGHGWVYGNSFPALSRHKLVLWFPFSVLRKKLQSSTLQYLLYIHSVKSLLQHDHNCKWPWPHISTKLQWQKLWWTHHGRQLVLLFLSPLRSWLTSNRNHVSKLNAVTVQCWGTSSSSSKTSLYIRLAAVKLRTCIAEITHCLQ